MSGHSKWATIHRKKGLIDADFPDFFKSAHLSPNKLLLFFPLKFLGLLFKILLDSSCNLLSNFLNNFLFDYIFRSPFWINFFYRKYFLPFFPDAFFVVAHSFYINTLKNLLY